MAVVPLDQTEYDRWWRSAESSLLMARLGAEHEQHHHACLHAEQPARQAVKGLLFAVGAGGRARGHNLSL
ncbi:MAG: HEPN domain-containing protein [Euzebyaceae bacterium]|nr:HEPN domain-containing protein [Euzebyaceae bacterium]